MKSLKKYAILAALFIGAVVEAQTVPPAKSLSAAEMRVRVEGIKKQIEDDHRHVLHLQALARKEKDVIKLTCINDKLVQVKAQMDLFDASSISLEAAINNTDDSPRETFSEIEKEGQDVKKLRGEADGCAGELEMYKQESKADFERPELDDPTSGEPFNNGEVMGDPEVDVPGYATPYK
jgi:hypothetical protein